jgi:hypothetical protein
MSPHGGRIFRVDTDFGEDPRPRTARELEKLGLRVATWRHYEATGAWVGELEAHAPHRLSE